MVHVERGILCEIRFDGFEVHQHIFELLHQKEARCHALTTRNGVAFRGGGADQFCVWGRWDENTRTGEHRAGMFAFENERTDEMRLSRRVSE